MVSDAKGWAKESIDIVPRKICPMLAWLNANTAYDWRPIIEFRFDAFYWGMRAYNKSDGSLAVDYGLEKITGHGDTGSISKTLEEFGTDALGNLLEYANANLKIT